MSQKASTLSPIVTIIIIFVIVSVITVIIAIIIHVVIITAVQVLTEIAGETLEQMAAAPRSKATPARAVAPSQEDEAADAEAEDLQARLNAIRS